MFTRGSFRYPYIVRLMGTGFFLCQASVAGGRQVKQEDPIHLSIQILLLNYWMIGSNLSTIFLLYGLLKFFINLCSVVVIELLMKMNVYYYILSKFYLTLASIYAHSSLNGIISMFCRLEFNFGSISSIKEFVISSDMSPLTFFKVIMCECVGVSMLDLVFFFNFLFGLCFIVVFVIFLSNFNLDFH